MNGGVRVDITSRWEVWDYTQWMVVWELTSHHDEKCETILNEWWCESWHHIKMRNVRLYSMNGGVRVDITSRWEVWDYTQWMGVCKFTLHKNEKCETILNEWGCVSSHYTKWEVWDYTQWMVVWELTSHHDEKCETILNEWWCESWHHITMRSVRLYSMNGGVRVDITSRWEVWDYTQWMGVCNFTLHKNEKCETILNEWGCVSSHYIKMRSVRLYSMNGGVWVYTLVADHSVRAAWLLSLCVLPCASRDAGLQPDVAKRIVMAAWMLHGLRFGRAGAGNLVFFRVEWLRPATKGTSCVQRVRLRSNRARSVPPLCSATSGCSCVRDSMRLLTLWLQIAV